MEPKKFAFVMEQTLGNAVHASNLKNAYRNETGVKIEWLDVNYPPTSRLEQLPVLRNWTIRAGLKARRAISKLNYKPDLFFFHTATLTVFSIDKTKGVPTIISLDATPKNLDSVGQAYNHKQGNRLSEEMKLAMHRRSYRAAKALVTWSHWVKKSLVEDYGIAPDKVEVIRPGTNLQLWQLSDQEWQTRRVKSNTDPVRILFVGGDFERKGGKLLLQTYREIIKSKGLKAELHLVTKADIPNEPELGLFVHHGIAANSPEMQKLYKQADIFALPTEGDCLPVVIGEALASALPVISTRVGAIDEAVLEGQNGFLIKPRDGAALSRALITLLESPNLRLQMGERSLALAKTDHDALQNSRKLLELCEVIANSKSLLTV
ncbi:MAG: glycosyltransferase family 4 protein [Chloroflexi bacterium]|uniref:Glycosyltransferase family 4 protein n=1 Tax=Candidatus Chlorohelix allophototropha TaxID=3003348 RepID=A0A8T7M2B4_9CHLR|nr:glycosyltransferase family 4 protein [Chloroflexota bacterium]WJW65898.1 glycosyltransferase family 4 protein [Chloroflexota bacterium L227-S17]